MAAATGGFVVAVIVAASSLLVIVIASVAAFTVVGRALLVLVDRGDRPLATATMVGVAATISWLCAVALVLPPGSIAGVSSLALGAATLVGWAWLRRGRNLLPTTVQWRSFAGALVAGAVALAPFVVLVANVGSTEFVHLDANHDGFFTTAVPRWLMEHRAVGSSGLTTDGSSTDLGLVGSVWDRYQTMSLRFGAEALVAVVARVTRSDPANVWLPVAATFAALVGLAAHRLTSALGRAGWWAVAAGAVAASTLAVRAISEQHLPTILAIALLLVLVTEVEHTTAGRPGATPAIVLALLVTAVVAVYGEVLALAGPPLVALVLVRSRRRRVWDGRRWGLVLAWSAALGAPVWWRSLRGATATNVPVGYVSPYGSSVAPFAAVRNALASPVDLATSFSSSPALVRVGVLVGLGLLVTGLVAACCIGRARTWWVTLALTTTVGWWWFGRDNASGYRQARWVEWAVPLLLLGALIGWAALTDRIAERRWRRAPRTPTFAPTAVLALVTLGLAVPGLATVARLRDDPTRRVDHAFTEMATWVERRDPTGGATVVWAADYFTNLWSPYALQDAPETAYLSIYYDYYDVRSFGSLARRRWLVLDTSAARSGELAPGSVVRENARFTLVDLVAGPARLVVGPLHQGRWSDRGQTVTVTLDPITAACTADAKVVPCL